MKINQAMNIANKHEKLQRNKIYHILPYKSTYYYKPILITLWVVGSLKISTGGLHINFKFPVNQTLKFHYTYGFILQIKKTVWIQISWLLERGGKILKVKSAIVLIR